MRKLIVATALALTATVAVASTKVNLKEVNKKIATIINAELTEVIKAVEFKIDTRSNFESVEKLNAGVSLSATAKSSVWSKSPTTLDVQGKVKTLLVTSQTAQLGADLAIGSKTDALGLYRYFAASQMKDYDYDNLTPLDQEYLAWFTAASEAKNLRQVATQLRDFITLLKKALLSDESGDMVAYAELINSLKVVTNGNEVTLKTTAVVTINDWLFQNLTIKKLSLNVSLNGLSVSGSFKFTESLESVKDLLQTANEFFANLEANKDETIEDLRQSARDYIGMAESFVQGDVD